jgi:hypothetical protein
MFKIIPIELKVISGNENRVLSLQKHSQPLFNILHTTIAVSSLFFHSSIKLRVEEGKYLKRSSPDPEPNKLNF